MWYENLSLRNTKDITTKGALFSKLYGNYKKQKGKLTLKDLATMADLTEARLKAFMDGLFENISDDGHAALINAIELPIERYDIFAKNTAIQSGQTQTPAVAAQAVVMQPTPTPTPTPKPKPEIPTAVIKPAVPPKPVTQPKPETQTAQTKPAAVASKTVKLSDITLENYVEEPFLLIYNQAENKIEIHPNYAKEIKPKAGQKMVLLPNAIIFGGKIVPGKGELK